MLKLPVPDSLLDSSKQGQLFFAQRVAELTFQYTKESYRVSTTTVPFLARELLTVIEDHNKFGLNPAGIERVLEELKRRSFHNSIVKELIGVPLESYFESGVDDLHKLEDSMRVFKMEVRPLRYIDQAITQLQSCAPNEKSKIDFLATELVCCLVNVGVSQEYIYQKICGIFFPDDRNASCDDMLNHFFSAVRLKSGGAPTFSAVVPVGTSLGVINSEILKIFGSEYVKRLPEDFIIPEEFAADNAGSAFLLMRDIKAPDHLTAAKNVKRGIVRLHDLLGLFYHKGSNELGQNILIIQVSEPSNSMVVKADRNLMQLISDNHKTLAARKLETMIKSLRLPQGADREKFFRVVDFHGMSLSSTIPENQLINLWTSLETIAPAVKGKSIIGSVCDGVLPFLGLQYIERLFLNAAKDIKRWNNKRFKDALASVDDGNEIVEKTFLLITSPEHGDLCSSLLKSMDDFPLLRYRIFDLNRRFKDGKNAELQIKNHLVKAEQQLHRIYRARNSIVHSAQKDQLTENLIISAHEYFDQVFFLTVELCSRPLNFDNYRDAFNFSKMAFRSYTEALGKLGGQPIVDASTAIWRAS